MFGSSDADAYSGKVVVACEFYDGFESVVSAGTAANLDAQISDGEIEFVVNDEDGFDGQMIELNACNDAFAAQVHERLGFEEIDRAIAEPCSSKKPLEFALRHGGAAGLTEQIEQHKTRVMPGFGIFRTRISKANNQQCIITHKKPKASKKHQITFYTKIEMMCIFLQYGWIGNFNAGFGEFGVRER